MKIPFICVNYNTAQETIKYIRNVKSISGCQMASIIVVDNSPTDDDFQLLSEFIKENYHNDRNISLLKTENKGYFQGLNDGILYAKGLGITNSFYVIGNNDIIFSENFITTLQSLTVKEDVLVLAPDVITNDNSHENPHVIEKIGFFRKLTYDIFFSHYSLARYVSRVKSVERRYKPHDPVRKEIHMGIGALYILTPHFFKYFRKLSEEVFLYGEEAVLSGQIRSVQGKILYEPDLVCYHNESSTTSQIEKRSKYELVRESYKTYRKYL